MTTSMPIGTKRGRPASAARAHLRQLMSEMSDRTFARFWWAWTVFAELDAMDTLYIDAVNRATRPNGSLNVAALERSAWEAIWQEVDHRAS